jgi:hypothetical protein
MVAAMLVIDCGARTPLADDELFGEGPVTSGSSIFLSSSNGMVNVGAPMSGTFFEADGFAGVSINAPIQSGSGAVELFSDNGPITVAAPIAGGFFDAEAYAPGALLTIGAPVIFESCAGVAAPSVPCVVAVCAENTIDVSLGVVAAWVSKRRVVFTLLLVLAGIIFVSYRSGTNAVIVLVTLAFPFPSTCRHTRLLSQLAT